MDIALTILAGILVITGFIGSVLPVLPGPPLSYLGLLLFHWSKYTQYSPAILWTLGIATLLITIFDQLFPIIMTKRMGGTKYGSWGTTIGLIIGFFIAPPIGIVLLPFIGALVGELIGGAQMHKAVKSAMASFLGFLLGTGIKLVIAGVIIYYYFSRLFELIF